ncbi:hypothetical protein HRI_001543300 [Hibiscus trionum]|uniref:F-box domain-containing protein n=1 Tax=Hibiscus trionum TaxID=183268 RepID=A0A9W7LXM7_HIBTR|nr:hypothetical protein HRI_001543300 [Hibiscus trionum]
MAKQVKSVGEIDRISSLPDHILYHILSFLPTKDAVRTSVVSPRWRYLFASESGQITSPTEGRGLQKTVRLGRRVWRVQSSLHGYLL